MEGALVILKEESNNDEEWLERFDASKQKEKVDRLSRHEIQSSPSWDHSYPALGSIRRPAQNDKANNNLQNIMRKH